MLTLTTLKGGQQFLFLNNIGKPFEETAVSLFVKVGLSRIYTRTQSLRTCRQEQILGSVVTITTAVYYNSFCYT